MKNLFIYTLSFALILICFDTNAQKSKKVAYKKGNSKVAVVHKGPKGGKKVVTYGPRKRYKRTKVVHYHYRHLPRRGALVTTVHAGALTVNFGGFRYRYHSGVWYKPSGKKWLVVRSPYGIRIKTLPVGYRRCIVGPRTYYYYYGTYYIKSNNEYEVVEAPTGAEIGSLPDGYNTITVNGQDYYELDDIYYMPSINNENEEILVVVNNPLD
tara:strand:- start:890 stop:1522 length:633 start_codon:yes stop_codon:yes gene_type:complete